MKFAAPASQPAAFYDYRSYTGYYFTNRCVSGWKEELGYPELPRSRWEGKTVNHSPQGHRNAVVLLTTPTYANNDLLTNIKSVLSSHFLLLCLIKLALCETF